MLPENVVIETSGKNPKYDTKMNSKGKIIEDLYVQIESICLDGFPLDEKYIHQMMPKLPIIACGGINDGENAWKLINCGASMIELYSALTFQGLSVVLDINKTIKKKLNNQTLQSFIDSRDSKFN